MSVHWGAAAYASTLFHVNTMWALEASPCIMAMPQCAIPPVMTVMRRTTCPVSGRCLATMHLTD